jgi:hypothetical protein
MVQELSSKRLGTPVKSLPRKKIRGFWAESDRSGRIQKKFAAKFPGAGNCNVAASRLQSHKKKSSFPEPSPSMHFDTSGNLVQSFTGVIAGKRITINTKPSDLF